MSGEAMNLAAGILVFAAALVPIIARLLRSASEKGRLRSIFSVTAGFIGLLFLLVADIGWLFGMHVGLVTLLCLINVALLVAGFIVDDTPMGRPQVAAFVVSMGTSAGFLAIIGAVAIAGSYAEKSQAALLEEITAATRSPTPSASPTPAQN